MPTISVGNIEMAVTDAQLESGAGRPVLLVHGFPLDRSMWEPQVAAIAGAGFRAIAPDLRGYGGSTLGKCDASQGVDMHQYADDLAQLIDAMRVDEPVVFVGFSMGGYIAWEFLDRHRDKLAAVVLCDTRASADDPEAAANRLKMADHVDTWGSRHVAELLIPKLFAPNTIKHHPELVEPVREMITQSPTAAIAAAQRGMSRRVDFSGRLAEFDIPTLAIGGEYDAISPPDEMRSMAAAMPNAKFTQIAGAGHMAPVENPEAVNEAIVKFVAAVL